MRSAFAMRVAETPDLLRCAARRSAPLILETFARVLEHDSLYFAIMVVGVFEMGHRRIGQMGFLDAAVSRRVNKRRDVLDEIVKLLDWSGFERLLSVITVSAKGEQSFPPLTMFKVLLLQRWHGLSDPAMEAALFDRLSFQRFAGLSLEDETPDHSTIWRFRERLNKDGLMESLFEELSRQLDAQGFLIKQGTMTMPR